MDFDTFINYFIFLKNYPFLILQFLSGFIPIVFCIIYFKSVWSNYRYLFFYALAIICLEVLENTFAAYSVNNHFIYLLYYIAESILLALFFMKEIGDKSYNRLVYILLPIVLIFLVVNLFSSKKLMDNYSVSIQSIVFIIFSIMNFYFIIFKKKIAFLSESVLFWVTTGIIINFSSKFFVSLFLYQLFKNKNLETFWAIVSISMVVYRVLIAIGISKTKLIVSRNNKI